MDQKLSITQSILAGRERDSARVIGIAILGVVLSLVVFQLVAGVFGPPEPRSFRSMHLTFGLIAVFLLYPTGRSKWNDPLNVWFFVDLFLIAIVIAVEIYTLYDLRAFYARISRLNPNDIFVGTIYIVVVLEATRRLIGWAMPIVAIAFLTYAQISEHLLGFLRLPSTRWAALVDMAFVSNDGILGMPIAISASEIFLFILFGSLLLKTGAGEVFTKLAFALTGRSAGGPAKAAVIASGIMGSVSGSSVANVVTTGNFTIPLMKKVGLDPVFAGGVEAVASSAGTITPPIMGAAAFIMAEILNVPYIYVAKAAIVPAFLYFFSLFMAIDFEAKKKGLRVQQEFIDNQAGSAKDILLGEGYAFLPLVVIIVALVSGTSPVRAALWGIGTLFLISFVKAETRLTPLILLIAFEDAVKSSLMVIISCATAGLIVSTLTTSGLGLSLTNSIVSVGGQHLLPALILVAVSSFILGMGMTSIAVYITVALTTVGALEKMGVVPVAAHMFALYFGVISYITPPVAIAAFAAAGISGADPMKTGYAAVKLGVAKFIVPFMFVYGPALLMEGTPGEIILAIATAILGTVALTAGIQGWFVKETKLLERLLLVGGGLTLIYPGLFTDVIGVMIILAVYMWQRMRLQNEKAFKTQQLPERG